MSPIRVLLVDSYALFRDGIRALLEREEDLSWVGEAWDAETAVRSALQLKPDVILMALQLSQGDALKAMQEIIAVLPQAKVIALTWLQDDDSIAAAIRAGITGYVLKHARASDLLQTIRTVAAGGAALDPAVALRALAQYRQMSIRTDPLSAQHVSVRELAMLKLISAGCSNREIAIALHLSEQTIKNTLSGLYHKLGVKKRTEAVITAMRLGLIPRQL